MTDAGRKGWLQADFPFSPTRWPFYYGWFVLGAGIVGLVASLPGQTFGVGVFTEALSEILGLSRTRLSEAYLIGTVASGFLLPYGGRLLDRFGVRVTVLLAAGGLALALFYLSVIDRVAAHGGAFVFITLGFFAIRFTGQGMLTVTARTMIVRWFDRYRELAVVVSSEAVSLLMNSGVWLLAGLVGLYAWDGAFRVLGFCLLGVAFFGWLTFRDSPESCGLPIDGRNLPPASDKPRHEDTIVRRDFTRGEALRTYAFWVFSLAFAWQGLLVTGYFFHIEPVAQELGFEGKQDLLALQPIAAVVGVVANLIGGWVSRKVRLKFLLVVFNIGAGLIPAAVLFLPGLLGKVLLVSGLGLSGGLWALLMGIFYARYYGRQHLGSINGMTMSVLVIASALGPRVFSAFADHAGAYIGSFYLSAGVSTLLFAGAWFARNPQRKLAPE